MSEPINLVSCSDGEFEVIKILVPKATVNIATDFRDEIYKLSDNGRSKIIIDLSTTELMDSTFLGALVVSLKKCFEKGGSIHLSSMPDSIALVFGLTKLNRVFNVFDSIEEAKSAFAK